MSDVHGGKVREAAAGLGRAPGDILDFSANINFLGPAAGVVAAARQALSEMSWYPADPPTEVRRAAASFLCVDEQSVLLGNGASELIFLVVASFRPKRVLILGPTFTEYERAARAWGAEVDYLWLPEERGFCLSANDLDIGDLDRRLQQADLLFICDPNNPTGSLLEREARQLLLERTRLLDVPVLVDESFLAFTRSWPEGSATRGEWPHVIVLHSFTKILAIPGLRVGALVVPERWREELGRRVPPWNLNCLAQAAALAGFAQPEVVRQTPAAVLHARGILATGLAQMTGVASVLPSDANFLCLRLGGVSSSDLTGMLRERGVLIRDLAQFPGMGPRYIRMAVRPPRENDILLGVMESVLECGVPGWAGRRVVEVIP